MSPKKARANEIESRASIRTIFLDSDHLQHERERPDMKRKYMNSDKAQRKEPELTSFFSQREEPELTISEVGMVAQIYNASKLTFYSINRNRRLGRSPRSLSAGVATGASAPPEVLVCRNFGQNP